MRTSTRSHVTHSTKLASDHKTEDGGRKLLLEAYDFIHSEKQVGKLIVSFGSGGAIREPLEFVEEENIPQSAIEVDPSIGQ